MPWRSRHKNRRDHAALITFVTVGALGLAVLISANIARIGHFFALFTTAG